MSLLGWKQGGSEGRRICACFSKSERSVRRIYIHLGELREEKGCFWKIFSASTIFYAWETAYLNSQRFNTLPPMLNTLIIGLALLLKALFITWIKPGGGLGWWDPSVRGSARACHFLVSPLRVLRGMWSPVLVKQYYFIVQEHGCANSSSWKTSQTTTVSIICWEHMFIATVHKAERKTVVERAAVSSVIGIQSSGFSSSFPSLSRGPGDTLPGSAWLRSQPIFGAFGVTTLCSRSSFLLLIIIFIFTQLLCSSFLCTV